MPKSKTSSVKTSSSVAAKTHPASAHAHVSQAEVLPPATFGARATAAIVDGLLWSFPFTLGLWYAATQVGLNDKIAAWLQVIMLVWLPATLLGLVYELVTVSRWGQTVGKFLSGIKVTSPTGSLLSWKRVWFRHQIAKTVSYTPVGMGAWAMFFDADRQTWHDHLSGSRVSQVEDKLGAGLAVAMILLLTQLGILMQAQQAFLADQPLVKLLTDLLAEVPRLM